MVLTGVTLLAIYETMLISAVGSSVLWYLPGLSSGVGVDLGIIAVSFPSCLCLCINQTLSMNLYGRTWYLLLFVHWPSAVVWSNDTEGVTIFQTWSVLFSKWFLSLSPLRLGTSCSMCPSTIDHADYLVLERYLDPLTSFCPRMLFPSLLIFFHLILVYSILVSILHLSL